MAESNNNFVTHVVLFRARAGQEDALTSLVERFPALREQIDGIEQAHAGRANADETTRGYTHALVMRFADAASLSAYEAHPAHEALVGELNPLVEQFLVLDVPTTQEAIR
jgi:antibiotic biosynthesis monooxygenase (ABM) superfamily enzyme